MFASMLGFIIAGGLLLLLSVGILVASMSALTKKETVAVRPQTILQITLNQSISERSSERLPAFNFSGFEVNSQLGLDAILKSLKSAATDDKVSGIFLDLSDVPAGHATIEEIRNALLDFKKSGKFIVSYAEMYSQKTYYLASVSDKIYLNPAGDMQFSGFAGQVMFFKGLLEKLDIEAQVIRHGKFKSAVEPFITDRMSEANKEQTLTYISAMWNHVLEGISESRKISIDELQKIASEFKIQSPEDAVNQKFVDGLAYKDEVLADLMQRVKAKSIKDISFLKLPKYALVAKSTSPVSTKDKIAVIYAQGSISGGEGDDESIGSERISRAIRKARLDPNVKAIVLRVNSPGGSALASDVIWREMILAKKEKPVVASMGDVAASGGYYIACAANKIVANPNTITGSIGVFGIIPNFQQFLNKKLGITVDGVKTNPYADYIPTTRPMSENEKQFLLRDIETIYSTFISHVAEARNLTTAQVDSIGQGRVWSGADAKRIGLIDEFGGIEVAIAEAAKLAKIDKYRITSLPEQKDVITQLTEMLTGENLSVRLKEQLGTAYPYLQYLESMSKMQGIQARLPYEITVE